MGFSPVAPVPSGPLAVALAALQADLTKLTSDFAAMAAIVQATATKPN